MVSKIFECLRGLCYLLLCMSTTALKQEDLNYMSEHLDVKYEVLDNFRDTIKRYEAQITLRNTGSKVIPGEGWEMYFCHLNLLEPDTLPDPDGVILRTYNIRFTHLQGCLFKMEPVDGFKELGPGEVRKIQFLSENFSVSKSDGLPNWYVTGRDLDPRVLTCTTGESFSFMGDFDTPNKWKRYDFKVKVEDEDEPEKTRLKKKQKQEEDGEYEEDEEEFIEGHDRYDPYTPRVRYAMNDAKDFGRIGRLLVPTPLQVSVNEEDTICLRTKDWVVVSPDKFSHEAIYLIGKLGLTRTSKRPHSHYIELIDSEVTVDFNGEVINSPEAYFLTVDPETSVIQVKAAAAHGAFYGIQTLLSLMDVNQTVPKVTIRDAPRYSYRGLMVDVARNFHPKEHIFRMMDVMAAYKLNKLHIHLTDDEGWRLEIPGLEELTKVGARRCHDPAEYDCILPFLGSSPVATPPGTGFYTVEDYRDILRYAVKNHIEVIPEVDMPGHGHAAIKAMESRRKRMLQLNNITESTRYVLVDNEDPSEYKSIQMYTDNAINPCLQSTYDFVSRIINTMYTIHRDVSPLRVYHFGGDEVAKGAWENSSLCMNIFREHLDIRDNKGLKEYFVKQISNLTSLYNLDLAAWEDGVMGAEDTPYIRSRLRNDNVYAYAWDNIWEWGVAGRAYKLANAGYKVVMAQATHLYFDHPYEPDPLERGLYWAPRFTDTRKTFGFMPKNLYWNADVSRSGDQLSHEDVCGDDDEFCVPLRKPENIIGIQGHLWSELVRGQDIADYMMFPRLLAMAERAWHEAEWESEDDNETRLALTNKDWEDFANTLGYKELHRLDTMGIKYRVPPPGAMISDGRLKANVAFPGLKVEYSIDDGITWCEVKGGSLDIQLHKQSQIKLRTRSADGKRVSRVVSLLAPASAGAPMLTLSLALISLLTLSHHIL